MERHQSVAEIVILIVPILTATLVLLTGLTMERHAGWGETKCAAVVRQNEYIILLHMLYIQSCMQHCDKVKERRKTLKLSVLYT